MEKEFVSYESAVKLKSLGFDEECFGFYNPTVTEKVIMNNDSYGGYGLSYEHIVGAPTFSQAFRWFREKHDIVSYIQRFKDNTFDYECNSPKFKEVIDFEDGPFDTYEEAELACLERLIEKSKSE